MPLFVDNKRFKKFADAVRFVIRSKGFDKKRASAYVAGIEQKQLGKPVRYEGAGKNVGSLLEKASVQAARQRRALKTKPHLGLKMQAIKAKNQARKSPRIKPPTVRV